MENKDQSQREGKYIDYHNARLLPAIYLVESEVKIAEGIGLSLSGRFSE